MGILQGFNLKINQNFAKENKTQKAYYYKAIVESNVYLKNETYQIVLLIEIIISFSILCPKYFHRCLLILTHINMF